MKISKQTIEILANFSNINMSMIFVEGQNQQIATKTLTFIAQAKLEESFTSEFGVYDMPQFLSVLSLFQEPDVEIEGNYIIIRENGQEVKVRKTEPLLIQSGIPKGKTLKFPPVDVEFELDWKIFDKLSKMVRTLNMKHISIFGDGNKISLKSINLSDTSSSSASFDVGLTDKKFNLIVEFERLKLLPHNYKIQLSSEKKIRFISQKADVIYTCPCEKNSTFN